MTASRRDAEAAHDGLPLATMWSNPGPEPLEGNEVRDLVRDRLFDQ